MEVVHSSQAGSRLRRQDSGYAIRIMSAPDVDLYFVDREHVLGFVHKVERELHELDAEAEG